MSYMDELDASELDNILCDYEPMVETDAFAVETNYMHNDRHNADNIVTELNNNPNVEIGSYSSKLYLAA